MTGRALFLENGVNDCGGILGGGDGSADHDVAAAAGNGFAGGGDAGLIVEVGARRTYAGSDQAEVLAEFLAQQGNFLR